MSAPGTKGKKVKHHEAQEFPTGIFVTALLIGAVVGGVAGGITAAPRIVVVQGGPSPSTGGPMNYTLVALLSGFKGSGGSIDGKKNPTLTGTVGQPITLNVLNGENIEHDLAVENAGINSTHLKKKGEQAMIVFTPSAKGTYIYVCELPGHKDLGMKGKIVVS